MSHSSVDVIRAFCAAWSHLDIDKLMEFFTDDVVYHNMPGPPVRGKDAVRKTIERFLRGWDRTEWEILNIVGTDSLVFAERVDRTDAGERHVDLPVTGVFELEGERIRAWRDYFDLATYTRAMNPG